MKDTVLRLRGEKETLLAKAQADGQKAGLEFARTGSYSQLAYAAESVDLDFLTSPAVFSDEQLGDEFVYLREAHQLPSSAWGQFIEGWQTGVLEVWRQVEEEP